MKVLIRLFVVVFVILINSCTINNSGIKSIKIAGSDTMYELTSLLAEGYMKTHSGISIHVEGGGTAKGIQTLIKNGIDICTASRTLKPNETKLLAEYYGSLGLVYLIAKDALSIYVNPDNKVKNFSMAQLKKIFTGEITNWKQLGGEDQSITVVTRNPNSGTYLYFKEHVLEDEDYIDNAVVIPTTKQIVEYVSKNKSAVSYGGMGYTGDIIHAEVDGILPTVNNVRNDTYPITRYLHFFVIKSPDGITKQFIDWVLSQDGQKIVNESGFVSLWENKK